MFCTKCGRKLEEGEICTCQQPKSAPKMQPQAKVEPQPVKKEQTEEPKPVDSQKGPSASPQNQKTETQSQSAQQQNAGYQQRQQYQQNANYQQGQQYQQNGNYQQNMTISRAHAEDPEKQKGQGKRIRRHWEVQKHFWEQLAVY